MHGLIAGNGKARIAGQRPGGGNAFGERGEIAVISDYLPQQLSEGEVAEAIKAAVAEIGATSIRDMGKVVAALKAKYPGRMDFGKASAQVKAALGG